MYRVLVPEKIAQEGMDYLTERGYEVKTGHGIDKQKLIEDLQDCDALLVRVAPVDEEVLSKCPNLKVIGKHGVGVDNIDLESARRHGIRVTNAPLSNAVAVAEHAVMLMLAWAKHLPLLASSYREDRYEEVRGNVKSDELEGATLGIVGLGKIGQKVSQRALAFEMTVLGYDPFVPADKAPQGVRMAPWEELFSKSDYITLHMPVTEKTAKCVGAKEFKMMKDTAVIINTARGGLIDEPALIEALRSGEIGGAGLDVSDPEPAIVNENPMFKMDNVIMTPHVAGNGKGALIRMATHAAQGIDEVLTGKPVTWPIV